MSDDIKRLITTWLDSSTVDYTSFWLINFPSNEVSKNRKLYRDIQVNKNTITKRLKSGAYRNMTEFDFTACSFSILARLATKPALEAYYKRMDKINKMFKEDK